MNLTNAGHVQVKYNSTWGTVCAASYLTYQSAKVICRQLNQGPPVKHHFMTKECAAKNQEAERVWLSDLNCRGFEDSIDQCPHRGWGILDPEYCQYCTPKLCSLCLICQPLDFNSTGTMNILPYYRREYHRHRHHHRRRCRHHHHGSLRKRTARDCAFPILRDIVSSFCRPECPNRPVA